MSDKIQLEHISASNILLFCKDFKEWKKRYIEKIPLENNIYLVTGTIVHKTLEEFFNIEPVAGISLKEHYTQKFNKIIDKYINEYHIQLIELENDTLNRVTIKEMLFNYLKKHYQQTMDMVTPKRTEYQAFTFNKPNINELELKEDTYKLIGYLDAVYISTDRFRRASRCYNILDYKTSKENVTTLFSDYYIQLMIYAYLLSCNQHKTDWVAIESIRYNTRHYFKVTEESLKKVEQLLKDYYTEIDKYNACEDKENFKPNLKIQNYI